MTAWCATRVRRRWLPSWRGAPARLAESVLGVTWIVLVSEVLGSLARLAPIPMLIALSGGALAIGAAMRLQPTQQDVSPSRSPREEIVAAGIGVAVVSAQWVSHVAA